MIQTIIFTFVVCGYLVLVVRWDKWNDVIKNLPTTFAIISFDEKYISAWSFDYFSSPFMESDDFPQTTCKDSLVAIMQNVLTKSCHPP